MSLLISNSFTNSFPITGTGETSGTDETSFFAFDRSTTSNQPISSDGSTLIACAQTPGDISVHGTKEEFLDRIRKLAGQNLPELILGSDPFKKPFAFGNDEKNPGFIVLDNGEKLPILEVIKVAREVKALADGGGIGLTHNLQDSDKESLSRLAQLAGTTISVNVPHKGLMDFGPNGEMSEKPGEVKSIVGPGGTLMRGGCSGIERY